MLKGKRRFAAFFFFLFPSNDLFKHFIFFSVADRISRLRGFEKWPIETSSLLRTSAVLQFISIKAGKKEGVFLLTAQ